DSSFATNNHGDSNSITLESDGTKVDLSSPITRIGGFPWIMRVRRYRRTQLLCISLKCSKSKESELWRCKPILTLTIKKETDRPVIEKLTHEFASWKVDGKRCEWELPFPGYYES
ncbi:hypothetical protein PFISCL1PPCAC_12290, partial [Pristionchus fissidentatus]